MWSTTEKTICSYCGITSRTQGAGNGCHACGRGIMVEDKEYEESNYWMSRQREKEEGRE